MGSPGSDFSEREWRNLLTDIHEGQAVPFVGPELSALSEVEGNPTLYEFAAHELVKSFQLDESWLPSGYSLLQATSLFLQTPGNSVEDLHYEARAILTKTAWKTPAPIRKLAEIDGFTLYVSTTVDSLLEQAINETRFGGAQQTRVVAYSEKSIVEDLPLENSARPSLSVFQLFGRLNAVGDYAITEEKVLEFSHRLQSRDMRPQNLFDILRSRTLLILGCGFPGWLARFLMRASKGDQLLTLGARGVIADRTSRNDIEFVRFLQRRHTRIYEAGDAAHFVDELHFRWKQRYGQQPFSLQAREEPQEESYRSESVFLSYAHEDLEAAKKIAAALDAAGADVWFDKLKLETGDRFRQVIAKNIESCSCFVPLISRHSASREKGFFRREWKKAIDELEEWRDDYPFVQPISIDDTPLTHPGIPVEFQERHARRLSDLPQFIEEAKRRIRQRRRVGRSV